MQTERPETTLGLCHRQRILTIAGQGWVCVRSLRSSWDPLNRICPVVLELPADAAGKDEAIVGGHDGPVYTGSFSSCVLERKVVEAAGVEPASGIVLHGEPTYLVRSKVSTGSSERTRLNPSSPIVCQPCAPDRSLGPIPPDDAPRPHAGLWTRAAAESGSVCERRIVGSCCFSDRFTGARNPVCLSTTDAIPSNPLRPHTRIRGEENALFCLHCNHAVERVLDPSAGQR